MILGGALALAVGLVSSLRSAKPKTNAGLVTEGAA
jgi:hypothetical protein